LDRWAPVSIAGEAIGPVAAPGTTLEALNLVGSIAVTGAADNGSGKVRLTVTSTATLTTGQIKDIAAVTGTTEANGTFAITVIDGTHIDLTTVAFANAYVSGGYIAGSIESLPGSLDDYLAAATARLAIFDTSHALGFLTGSTLEATVTTCEQTFVDSRIWCRGFYPITDASTVYGSLGKRENFATAPTYSTETLVNSQGFCPARVSTRAARAKIRIPAGTSWTYVRGATPDAEQSGRR
jgi:hypothetical protein